MMKENVQEMGKEDLQHFVAQYSNSSDVTATEDQCNVVWKSTFNFLQVPRSELISESEGSMEAFSIHRDSLAAIQILSRNKKQLNETITVDQFDTLLNIANIGRTNKEDINDSAIVVEALKCLYNLVYESNNCRIICLKSEAINGIVRRLRTYISTSISIYRDKNLTWDMQYFDMKLLFLITAINPDGRTKVRDDQNGLICLVRLIELMIKEQSNLQNRPQGLNDRQVNLVVEIMKVLFNFTSVATEKIGDIQFRELAVVLHNLLLLRAASEEKHIELWSTTINLLTTVPTACYSELVIPMHIHVDSLVNGINWGQKISAIRCDIEMFGNTVKDNAETIEGDRNGTIETEQSDKEMPKEANVCQIESSKKVPKKLCEIKSKQSAKAMSKKANVRPTKSSRSSKSLPTTECPDCGKTITKKGLERHQKEQHRGDKLKCAICDFATKRPAYLDDHIRRKHFETMKMGRPSRKENRKRSSRRPRSPFRAHTFVNRHQNSLTMIAQASAQEQLLERLHHGFNVLEESRRKNEIEVSKIKTRVTMVESKQHQDTLPEDRSIPSLLTFLNLKDDCTKKDIDSTINLRLMEISSESTVSSDIFTTSDMTKERREQLAMFYNDASNKLHKWRRNRDYSK